MNQMSLPTDTRDLTLTNGRVLHVRALRPSDRTIYERAVVDLSPRSRYLRFLAPIQRPSEKLLDQMTHVDGEQHVAFVALTPDEKTALGVVRYVRDRDDPTRAEVAIAVADGWQRLGMGRELMRQTAEHARRSGVRVLLGTTLSENGEAARLLSASGFSVASADGLYRIHHRRLAA
jgi:acetyltransferase